MESQESKKNESGDILALSSAINYLGLHLYQKLAKEQRNVFFSPLSLSSVLSMLFCGTSGETLSEMRRVLGFENAKVADDKVKNCFPFLLRDLNKMSNTYKLSSCNVMLSQKDFAIKKNFKKILSESFEALILEVDFRKQSEKAALTANSWVKRKTNGMIPKLVDSLDTDAVMVLLNAVYFKGFWVHRFKKDSTYAQTFYNKGLEDNTTEVEMMHQKESFPFVDRGTYKALQLPYKGGKIAMLILLPNDINGLGDLEGKLSSDFIDELLTHMSEQDVIVALPKFRFEYNKSMKDDFRSLGLQKTFCRGAEFDGISNSKDLLLSEIVHKAVIEVNELGNEAAAASACEIYATSVDLDPEFVVDHPFLFIIYNTKCNLILSIGRVDEL